MNATLTPYTLVPGFVTMFMLWRVVSNQSVNKNSDVKSIDSLVDGNTDAAVHTPKYNKDILTAPCSISETVTVLPSLELLQATMNNTGRIATEHFTKSLEGLSSLRALGVVAVALATHHRTVYEYNRYSNPTPPC